MGALADESETFRPCTRCVALCPAEPCVSCAHNRMAIALLKQQIPRAMVPVSEMPLVKELRAALREACDIADWIASADHHGHQHNGYERIAELLKLAPP